MKHFTISLLLFGILFISFISGRAQESSDTSLVSNPEDTTLTPEDSLKTFISDIIKEVNRRAELIDNIISDGDIKIKTATIDNSGSIDIKVKKKDDVWFKITGPLGINIAEAHFGRKKFLFVNNRADEVITGSTTVINIGTLAKVRCTFDDLLNVFSGTVHIPKAKSDSLSIEDANSQYVVVMKRGTITRKYWVDKTNYTVYKYVYYGKSGATLIQFEFSRFYNVGDGTYAKLIEVRRPKQREYFSLSFDGFNMNQSYINFQVDVPSDAIRKNWK
jgi:hypothetical protein